MGFGINPSAKREWTPGRIATLFGVRSCRRCGDGRSDFFGGRTELSGTNRVVEFERILTATATTTTSGSQRAGKDCGTKGKEMYVRASVQIDLFHTSRQLWISWDSSLSPVWCILPCWAAANGCSCHIACATSEELESGFGDCGRPGQLIMAE